MHKRSLIIVGVLAVAVIILAAFYFSRNQNPASRDFTAEQKIVTTSDIPSGFPADFPVEAGSTVLQNYESVTNDGRKQSTRVATTAKSAEEATSIYRDYFIQRGWSDISTKQADSTTLRLFLQRGDNRLSITFTANAGSANTIEITLTEVETGVKK